MTETLALYVHWPFCRSKCPYCDFNSHVREGVDASEWLGAYLREMAYVAEKTPNRELVSIFFGGGTPSLMPPATVAAIIEAAGKHWRMAPGIEITLEANPTSVEAASFKGFRAAGVNRVSLGVQALNEADLKFLGRQHSAGEAMQAVALAEKTFPRFSFDLIYARPGQSAAAWEAELKEAIGYAGAHLSLYQLTIEENTAFHPAHKRGDFILPDEERSAELYELTQQVMEDAGLPAYEISNHAHAGEASRHNLAYWRGEDYAGIGPGAHGRLTLNGKRFATMAMKSPERWLEKVGRDGQGMEIWQDVPPAEEREERLMMRLRLTEGFPLADLPYIDASAFRKLQQNGLLETSDSAVVPTLKGRLLLNYLTAELLG